MPSEHGNGPRPTPRAFLTGEWAVEPSRNVILRDGREVRLEPRVMDVLVCLAGRRGEVVSKDELVAEVWEGRYVTDDVLTVSVYALRKALGDEARQPRYLETIPRRGYRWLAPVEEPPCAAPTPLAQVRQQRSWLAAGAALALLVIAAWLVSNMPLRSNHRRSADVHEAITKGRYFLDQRSITGWKQALEEFRRAVALDPNDPGAHAGLADAYSNMSDFGVASPAELRPQAMAAALRALELDGDSAEAHAALGRAQFLFDWNFASAGQSLERAIELNPDFMPAQQAMAWVRSAEGRHPEASAAARRALQLDPVNIARYNELAWVLALAGQYEEASRQVDRALQVNPRSWEARMMKGTTESLAGHPDAAFVAYREGLQTLHVPPEALRRLDVAYQAEGLAGLYRLWLNPPPRSNSMPLSHTWRARLYACVGEFDHAIESLQQAYEQGEGALAWVNVEPSFQPLRADARFQRIAARVGAQN
jgi:DNA-binding winged helix-turn-helix (wHTH) protein/Tfp pilus assembly protein PilF